MFLASLLESMGTFLAVLTPLVAVPLTVITFYLRSLREHQVSWHAELVRRVDALEASTTDLRKALSEFERDFTTKEEWLRECMHARRLLERLTAATVRIETVMRNVLPDVSQELAANRGGAGRPNEDQTRVAGPGNGGEDDQ